jgi:hypothetical protein
MASGDAIGEFSFQATGVTLTPAGAGGTNQINYEGTASGYGTVIGTLTLEVPEAGAKSGPCSWIGQGFLENGDVVVGRAFGFWEESGQHTWRIRSTNQVSDGTMFASDGEVKLDGRTYTGTIIDWS